MNTFIDIHGHYAWNVDDGMPCKEDCVQALKTASKQGIKKIIATPHVIPGATTKEELTAILNRIGDLKELAKEYGIEIYQGCEFFLNHDYLDALYDKQFINIENTKYLLCEYDVRKKFPDDAEDKLYELRCAGNKPIIAHIERYFQDKLELDRIKDLFNDGYVIQINTSSILGSSGKHAQKYAMKLLEEGLVHAIATDTHRCDGRRSPNLLETYEYLKGKVSEDNLQLLMYDNPLAIINGKNVDSMKVEKKSFIKRLFGG